MRPSGTRRVLPNVGPRTGGGVLPAVSTGEAMTEAVFDMLSGDDGGQVDSSMS